MLVTVFAWATTARAVGGWLRSAPFRPVPAVATAVFGAAAGVFAYIGGLAAMEAFVAPALPAEVTESVSTGLLVGTLAAIALVVVVVSLTPGERMRRLRSRVYALVLTSAPVAAPLTTRGSSTGVAPVPESRQFRHLEPARSERPT